MRRLKVLYNLLCSLFILKTPGGTVYLKNLQATLTVHDLASTAEKDNVHISHVATKN